MDMLANAKRDLLTGFYAKDEIDFALNRTKANYNIYRKPFSILLLDMDYFKAYNDKYGHLDGDEVLKYFASTLRLSIDMAECLPFRFGGDEFLILFPGKSSAQACAIADDLKKNLRARPFLMRGRRFKMSFSGGIASYPADGVNNEDLLRKADKAMYVSKARGKGRTTQYRMMRLKLVRVSLLLFLIIILGTVVFYLRISLDKETISQWIKRFKKLQVSVSSRPIQLIPQEVDTVYLKSGGVLKGIIVQEMRDAIELRLQLDKGEGNMVIKRVNIQDIKRRRK